MAPSGSSGKTRICASIVTKRSSRSPRTQSYSMYPATSVEGHPELRATLITHAAGKEQSKRVSLDRKAEFKERSNLYFPHKTHLDRQGIISPDGEVVLSCASCHVPDPGGRRMAPIRFEEHCHRCHKLTFEFDDPRREVPHGTRRQF